MAIENLPDLRATHDDSTPLSGQIAIEDTDYSILFSEPVLGLVESRALMHLPQQSLVPFESPLPPAVLSPKPQFVSYGNAIPRFSTDRSATSLFGRDILDEVYTFAAPARNAIGMIDAGIELAGDVIQMAGLIAAKTKAGKRVARDVRKIYQEVQQFLVD